MSLVALVARQEATRLRWGRHNWNAVHRAWRARRSGIRLLTPCGQDGRHPSTANIPGGRTDLTLPPRPTWRPAIDAAFAWWDEDAATPGFPPWIPGVTRVLHPRRYPRRGSLP